MPIDMHAGENRSDRGDTIQPQIRDDDLPSSLARGSYPPQQQSDTSCKGATPSSSESQPSTIAGNKRPRALQSETVEEKRMRLQAKLQDLQDQRATLAESMCLLATESVVTDAANKSENVNKALANAKSITNSHIKRLNQYNEIKDIAQGLIGLIAERRGERVRDVMKEFGVDDKD